MPHRKNTVIKTRYRSIEDCARYCLDIEKEEMYIAPIYSRKIYRRVYEDQFDLSCNNRYIGAFHFVGRIIEREGHIFMEGEIAVKTYIQVTIVLSYLLATAMIITAKAYAPLSLVMFVPSIVLTVYLKLNDRLYRVLTQRVGVNRR